jgi:hydrogenase maturation protease
VNIHRAIVIGVGNPYRRDDGFGPAVLSLLRDEHLSGVDLVECDGEPGRLIDLWDGAPLAVVVDAVRAEPTRPGRLHRLSAHHPAVTRPAGASSHGAGLGEAVDLARALDRMPERLLLFAVEADDVGFGLGLTPAVADAAREVAAEIAELVGAGVGR